MTSHQLEFPEPLPVFSTESPILYIAMEYITESTLLPQWSEMSDVQKSSVSEILQSYLDEIRRLPSLGYYGRLGYGQMHETIFWTGDEDKSGSSIKAFQGLYYGDGWKITSNCCNNSSHAHKANFYEKSLPVIFYGHKLTSHMATCSVSRSLCVRKIRINIID